MVPDQRGSESRPVWTFLPQFSLAVSTRGGSGRRPSAPLNGATPAELLQSNSRAGSASGLTLKFKRFWGRGLGAGPVVLKLSGWSDPGSHMEAEVLPSSPADTDGSV